MCSNYAAKDFKPRAGKKYGEAAYISTALESQKKTKKSFFSFLATQKNNRFLKDVSKEVGGV
ncbi:MAG: hypothetical protein QW343_02135 [Candidatus Norongarragalinales archaeon]